MSAHNTRPNPDRRLFLGAALACALPPLPARAQDKLTPVKGIVPEKPAPHRFALKAESVKARLGGADKAESTLNRLVLRDAAASPALASPVLASPVLASPFPVIRLRAGEAFALEIENALAEPLALHLRGMRGPNDADGVPGLTQSPIAPGAKHTLAFPGTQAGTFILQPSLPEQAAAQNARGLFAVIVIEEAKAGKENMLAKAGKENMLAKAGKENMLAKAGKEKVLAEADTTLFDHDIVLAFSDWRLDDKGALAEDFLARADSARLGRLGNMLAVNNAPAPAHLEVRPGARIRVRMVNVANARVVPLKVSGYPAEVFAIDSTPCQPFDPLKRTVIMAPATRIEMVLQAPQEAGARGAIEAKLGDGLPLYTFRTAGTPIAPRGKLAALPDPGLPPAIRLQDATRAELVIEGGIGTKPEEATPEALARRFPNARQVFTLSSPTGGAEMPGGFARRPVARLRKGGVFVLALNNRTAWPQVIGVHGHAFRLLHPYDDGWEPYFMDTLYLAPGTKAHIALIAENPGKWAIRSTLAEHYGTGVATWFEVT